MKKFLITLFSIMFVAGVVSAERYVMITHGKMNAVRALERQMDDIDSRNIVAIAKVTSMPKVVNNSNN